jgi:hypothetical protein
MANRTLSGILVIAFTYGVAGCSGSNPTSSSTSVAAPSSVPEVGGGPAAAPRPPSHPILPVTGITGFVLDTGYRPVAGAIVTVVDGPQAGASATADAAGQFSLSGAFEKTTRFRATKDGYVTATQTWSCSVPSCPDDVGSSRPWLGFYLAAHGSSVNMAGNFTLTFIADSACTAIPTELRTRSYAVTVGPSSRLDASFSATATGAAFLGGLSGFDVGVTGNYVDLWLHGGHDPALVEQIGPTSYLAYSGNAAASIATSPVSNVSTFFDGWIDYCVTEAPLGSRYNCGTSNSTGTPIPGAAATYAHCESKNHRLILTRQ